MKTLHPEIQRGREREKARLLDNYRERWSNVTKGKRCRQIKQERGKERDRQTDRERKTNGKKEKTRGSERG